MARTLGTLIAIVLICLLAYPFVREAYHRYEVASALDTVMTPGDRAAFQSWRGDAVSFGKSLLVRCEMANGEDSPACERYHFAAR